MKKNFLSIFVMAICAIPWAANAETLEIYTLNAPPLTMEGADKHGIDGDVLLEAVRRAGFKANLNFIPWRRGQSIVESGENLLIIPFSRTAERETRFTWIAPILELERSFATLEKPIDSIEQAKAEGKTILVGMGSAQEAMLMAHGIDKKYRIEQVIGLSEVQMLTTGRVDTWFNSSLETLWKWKNSGEKRKAVIGKAVSSDTSYVACSKKCSRDIVEPIRKAIESMREDGTIKKIVDGYLSN